jgi:hypothetical protein
VLPCQIWPCNVRDRSAMFAQVRFAQQPVFRQLFEATSGTYTCLIASRHGGEALIIDPVLERVDRYLQLVASSTWKPSG